MPHADHDPQPDALPRWQALGEGGEACGGGPHAEAVTLASEPWRRRAKPSGRATPTRWTVGAP